MIKTETINTACIGPANVKTYIDIDKIKHDIMVTIDGVEYKFNLPLLIEYFKNLGLFIKTGDDEDENS